MTEKLLSAQEVAEQLGISQDTVYRLTQKKDGLRAYKVGRLTRFKPSDVEAYITAQTIIPPEKRMSMPGMSRFQYRPGMRVVSL